MYFDAFLHAYTSSPFVVAAANEGKVSVVDVRRYKCIITHGRSLDVVCRWMKKVEHLNRQQVADKQVIFLVICMSLAEHQAICAGREPGSLSSQW
jgi:hypothetical protein